jgi:hypothetical protein
LSYKSPQTHRDLQFSGLRVCVRTAKAKLQRLKPHSFCGVNVVAEATTHKHSRFATQTLKPKYCQRFDVAAEVDDPGPAEAATHKAYL